MSLELQEATIIEDILYVLMVRVLVSHLICRALKANTSVITNPTTLQVNQIVLPVQG
jgi:hypothetical protein